MNRVHVAAALLVALSLTAIPTLAQDSQPTVLIGRVTQTSIPFLCTNLGVADVCLSDTCEATGTIAIVPRLNGTVFIHFDRVFDPGQVCIPIGLGNAEGVGDRENGWTADNFPQHVSAHHTLLPFGNGVYHLRSVSFGDLIEEGNFTIVA